MTRVSVACLFDMLQALDRTMEIGAIRRVVAKAGGRSGTWSG
jgi:molybdenum cofactor biosynthesis enzyme